ncbi:MULTISPECIES: NAD(P)H-dependent oxidoreductase [unclassified Bordetella]|uniref:NAD(P)H-dependent oxidoreductase n=1 Tax=unclassified Bordetella TaxID=2630031 RepID=UPI00132BFE5C|nr:MULTISPECIES: flagellar biosynthesis protein FlgA [unclassified Bordetella]MVW70729.1 flagellar biosynthesis protein FlgA [Bordetella sp. 15P40C-2]MVW77603.1 flagellar biosynthesis protein FlgA [Bordetella sp. 02P26C-1]
MNFHQYFSQVKHPVQCCVVGSGGFGRSFLAQSLRVPLMDCRIAVDIDAAISVQAMQAVGIAPDRIKICETPEAARKAWEEGAFIATSRLDTVAGLPLDIVVEATGNPEAGARHAQIALDAGLHLALVSKEVDSVIGPALAHEARGKQRVVTPVDGDQPSLLIGLITWAEVLGLEIICAGKASEYDFVFDPQTGDLTSNGVTIAAPELASYWSVPAGHAQATVEARAHIARELPQRTVPDFCEMLVTANSTGFKPDLPDMHAPILRTAELPEVLRLRSEGGILENSGTLEVFHCLRRPDEISFAGGVFVVVRCHDEPSWELLAGKGHVVSADRRTALIFLSRHLLGLEAATSIIEAAGMGISSGSAAPRPVLDLVARTTEDFPAGKVLTMGGHHHTIDSVTPMLVDAAPLGDRTPVPFYLMANQTLRRAVKKGEVICFGDLEIAPDSALLRIRQRQDAIFFGDDAPAR